MPSTPRPLVGARDRSVGAAARESASFQANPDLFYVPGYSDKRRQIDSELARGMQPTVSLPYRLHWPRHAKPGGGGDGDAMRFLANGYEMVTKDNLAKYGITRMQPHWQVGADGSIRNGDVLLMACAAEQAQENEAQVRRAIDSQASDTQTSAALHSAGRELDRAGGLTTSESQSRLEITKG